MTNINPCLSSTEKLQAKNFLHFGKLEKVQITHDCPIHGVSVREVVNVIADKARQTCPKCESEKADAERMARLMLRRQKQAYESGITHYTTFEAWQPNTDRMATVLEFTKGYATTPTGNLIMSGATGTGKTLLANLIASRFVDDEKSVLLVRSSEIHEMVRATWSKSSRETETDVLDNIISQDLLVIDELGEADLSHNAEMRQADRERLSRIIDGRYTKGLPTVITTNLTKPQIIERLGDRAWDRLQQNAVFIAFDWGSFRQMNSKFLEI